MALTSQKYSINKQTKSQRNIHCNAFTTRTSARVCQ